MRFCLSFSFSKRTEIRKSIETQNKEKNICLGQLVSRLSSGLFLANFTCFIVWNKSILSWIHHIYYRVYDFVWFRICLNFDSAKLITVKWQAPIHDQHRKKKKLWSKRRRRSEFTIRNYHVKFISMRFYRSKNRK